MYTNLYFGNSSHNILIMSTKLDPWDAESPEEIVEANVDFFFEVFPEVPRSKEFSVRDFVKAIVDDGLSDSAKEDMVVGNGGHNEKSLY